MLHALLALNFSDAGNSVIGRRQAHSVWSAAGKIGSAQAQAGAKLFGIRSVCDGMDNARSNGAAHSHAGMVG